MKRTSLFALAALALTLGATAPQAHAQAGGGLARTMKKFGQMLTPEHSNIRELLKRDDVKNEISLSQRQGEQLRDLEEKVVTDSHQRAQNAAPADPNALKDLPEDERAAKQQEMRQKQQEARQNSEAAISDDIDKKAAAVLRPEQIKRLHELDLQRRGALALSDKRVADQINLTPEQRSKVTTLLNDFHKSRTDLFTATFAAMRPTPGADPNTPPQRPDPAALEAKMEEMQTKLAKVKTDIEAKVVALLTEDQRAAWTAAQGPKFKFREVE